MGAVHVEHKGDMLFESTIGHHTIVTHYAKAASHKDRAVTPPELCATALASCVATMVAIFCNNSKIDPAGIAVDLTYEYLEDPTRLGDFKVRIKVPHADPERHRKGILRVAHMCPVHATIEKGSEVEFELVE